MITKVVVMLLVVISLATPVFASEIKAPEAPLDIQPMVPDEPESFADGMLWVLKQTISKISPSFTEAMKLCGSIIIIIMLVSFAKFLPGASGLPIGLVGVLSLSVLILSPSKSMIHMSADTVKQLQEYSKLLLPVMTTALAMQGGGTSATALYAGTALFNTLLSALISSVLIPMTYIYICLCVAGSAFSNESLDRMKSVIKGTIIWSLKTILYVFTGYMGITGVVSGTTDAAALKATKLTISGVVPVIGNILSDASEAVLVSAGVMKQAAGVYGLIVTFAIWLSPFLKIGIQYLMLKLTASICDMFGDKNAVKLVHDFTGTLAILLAISGAMCLLSLISTVCFMKGMNI